MGDLGSETRGSTESCGLRADLRRRGCCGFAGWGWGLCRRGRVRSGCPRGRGGGLCLRMKIGWKHRRRICWTHDGPALCMATRACFVHLLWTRACKEAAPRPVLFRLIVCVDSSLLHVCRCSSLWLFCYMQAATVGHSVVVRSARRRFGRRDNMSGNVDSCTGRLHK